MLDFRWTRGAVEMSAALSQCRRSCRPSSANGQDRSPNDFYDGSYSRRLQAQASHCEASACSTCAADGRARSSAEGSLCIRLLDRALVERLEHSIETVQVKRDVAPPRIVVDLRQRAVERCIHLANSAT